MTSSTGSLVTNIKSESKIMGTDILLPLCCFTKYENERIDYTDGKHKETQSFTDFC